MVSSIYDVKYIFTINTCASIVRCEKILFIPLFCPPIRIFLSCCRGFWAGLRTFRQFFHDAKHSEPGQRRSSVFRRLPQTHERSSFLDSSLPGSRVPQHGAACTRETPPGAVPSDSAGVRFAIPARCPVSHSCTASRQSLPESQNILRLRSN